MYNKEIITYGSTMSKIILKSSNEIIKNRTHSSDNDFGLIDRINQADWSKMIKVG